MRWLSRLIASIPQHAQQARLPFRLRNARECRDAWSKLPIESPSGNRTCLLDIRHVAADGEQGRRFHALVTLLSRSGFDLWLVPRLCFLQTGKKCFKRAAVRSTRMFGTHATPGRFDLCFSDCVNEHPLADRTLKVSYDTSRELKAGEIPLPYSFYPDIWNRREDELLQQYREQPRQWRLLFGGYFQEKSYTKIKKYKRQQVVNRFALVSEVMEQYGDRTKQVLNGEELEETKNSIVDGFVLIDSQRYRLDPLDWLSVLSRSNFFLAAPGGDYPFSHNCIESLAVGTIPVLEYDQLFRPGLEDGVNCITFRGKSGIGPAIERINAMTPSEIQALRNAAIEYYEQHLSPNAFRQRIDDQFAKGLHVFPYLAKQAQAA